MFPLCTMSVPGKESDRLLRVLSFNVWYVQLVGRAPLTPQGSRVHLQGPPTAHRSDSCPHCRVQLRHCLPARAVDIQRLRDCQARGAQGPALFALLPHVRMPQYTGSSDAFRGALGSGLAVFTRFPLISAQALPYSLSGSPAHPQDGDFFVNKAAANVVLLHPWLGEVEVWNTHVRCASS